MFRFPTFQSNLWHYLYTFSKFRERMYHHFALCATEFFSCAQERNKATASVIFQLSSNFQFFLRYDQMLLISLWFSFRSNSRNAAFRDLHKNPAHPRWTNLCVLKPNRVTSKRVAFTSNSRRDNPSGNKLYLIVTPLS